MNKLLAVLLFVVSAVVAGAQIVQPGGSNYTLPAAGTALGGTKNGACAAGNHADGTYNGDGTPHCSADTGAQPRWYRMGTISQAGATSFDQGSVYEMKWMYDTDCQILTTLNGCFKALTSRGAYLSEVVTYSESPDFIHWNHSTARAIPGAHAHGWFGKIGANYYYYGVNTATGNVERFICASAACVTNEGAAPGGWGSATVLTLTESGVESWWNPHVYGPGELDATANWYMTIAGKDASVLYKEYLFTSADGATWTRYASNPYYNNLQIETFDIHKVGGDLYACAHGSAAVTPEDASPSLLYMMKSDTGLPEGPWSIVGEAPFLTSLTPDEGAVAYGTGANSGGQVADCHMAEVGGRTYLSYSATIGQIKGMHVNGLIADAPLASLVASLVPVQPSGGNSFSSVAVSTASSRVGTLQVGPDNGTSFSGENITLRLTSTIEPYMWFGVNSDAYQERQDPNKTGTTLYMKPETSCAATHIILRFTTLANADKVAIDAGMDSSCNPVTNLYGLTAASVPATPLPTPGTTLTLAAPRGYGFCTGTCTVTLPVPAAGYEFCIRNSNNVSTVITLANISSVYYEKTDRTGYGTVNYKLVSGGAVTDQICVVGYDATHYVVMSSTGTWTDTAP